MSGSERFLQRLGPQSWSVAIGWLEVVVIRESWIVHR